ncbi:MAG: methyltransferase domain-containing protein [candidate division NC10 bacterium]|nr:methyltransferase domain-containing protein [candidate division NC10 bacterium]
MLQPSFDTTAAAYDRRIGRWSRLYIPALVAAARICPGDRVLDVATGTGEAAIAAAAIAGPGGRVLGSDISLPMLSVARSKAGGIVVATMDALALACRDESVDAVICQLGLMLFPDAARGLQEFRRVLRDGRWMAACVWSLPERAPFIGIFDDVMGRHVPDKREEIMASTSLGDRRRLHDLVAGAGFREVSVTPVTQQIAFATFEEYWEPIAAGGSTTAALYRDLHEAARTSVRTEVRTRMQSHFLGERLVFETEVLLAAGRK